MSEADQFRQYADEAMLGLANPKPKKRNGSCLSLRAYGRKRRSRATVRQRPGPCKAASVGGLVQKLEALSSFPQFRSRPIGRSPFGAGRV
jgi:hypothetical protein